MTRIRIQSIYVEYSYIFYPDLPVVDILSHFLYQMSMLTCSFSPSLHKYMCVYKTYIYHVCTYMCVYFYVHILVFLSLLEISYMAFYILLCVFFLRIRILSCIQVNFKLIVFLIFHLYSALLGL